MKEQIFNKATELRSLFTTSVEELSYNDLNEILKVLRVCAMDIDIIMKHKADEIGQTLNNEQYRGK